MPGLHYHVLYHRPTFPALLRDPAGILLAARLMPNSSKTVYVTQAYGSEKLLACVEHGVHSCFYNVRETGHIYDKRHGPSTTKCWLVTQTGMGKTLAALPYAHSHPMKFFIYSTIDAA